MRTVWTHILAVLIGAVLTGGSAAWATSDSSTPPTHQDFVRLNDSTARIANELGTMNTHVGDICHVLISNPAYTGPLCR